MILQEISEALQKGNRKMVAALVEQALSEGIAAKDILEQGLLDGMNIIGIKFKNSEVYVPEVLIAARAMNAGTSILKEDTTMLRPPESKLRLMWKEVLLIPVQSAMTATP